MYAKVQGSTVIKYPYTLMDFLTDTNNLISTTGQDYTVLFPNTPAATGGYTLVSVTAVTQPSYSIDTQTITEGVPALVNTTWTQTWVVTDMALADAQTGRIATLTTAYNTATQASVSYTSKGGVTQTFQSDSQAISNLSKMLLAFQSTTTVPTGFYWVAADNTQVPFTYTDLQGLANTIGTQGVTAFQHLQTQKASVNSATTVAAVQAVVW